MPFLWCFFWPLQKNASKTQSIKNKSSIIHIFLFKITNSINTFEIDGSCAVPHLLQFHSKKVKVNIPAELKQLF